MANSSYLTRIVEPFVVEWVSQNIAIPLTKHRLPVGPRTDGKPVEFEFDGVSEDRQIGLLVSTSLTIKPGGTRKIHVDASILLNTPFTRRLMAFISEDVQKNFLNKCDGLLPLHKIEMLVCTTLPPEMSAAIALFQASAKTEVGDLGKVWKLGGARR